MSSRVAVLATLLLAGACGGRGGNAQAGDPAPAAPEDSLPPSIAASWGELRRLSRTILEGPIPPDALRRLAERLENPDLPADERVRLLGLLAPGVSRSVRFSADTELRRVTATLKEPAEKDPAVAPALARALLAEPMAGVRSRLAAVLAEIRPAFPAAGDAAAREILLAAAADKSSTASLRRDAVRALGPAGTEADERALADLLGDSDALLRVEALRSLAGRAGLVGTARSALERAAEGDPEAQVRASALTSLAGSVPDGKARALLLERLSADKDASVKHAAASALWEVPFDSDAIRGLADVRAAEADPTVRAAVVELLGFQTLPAARDALREAARSDPEESVRARAKELAEAPRR
ncbi:MAG: HEAT repeat domain-containing protein [Planctomycetales bacterium]|nr:HEAT repeat domain-containing protein [Planctomycetales bacterium]